MVLSVIVALTLTPALCAQYLKQVKAGHHLEKTGFFGWFNNGFRKMTSGVRASVANLVKHIARLMVIYLVLVGAVVWGYMHLPSSFMPAEDQGVLLMMMQSPAGSTAERTDAALDRFQKMVSKSEAKMWIRLLCARILVCRYGSEQRHGLFEVERLERTKDAGYEHRRHHGSRAGPALLTDV